MQSRWLKQDPIGYRIPGTSIYQNNSICNSDWSNCSRCSLKHGRRRVAIRNDGLRYYRGDKPIRLLAIAERPGDTENSSGVPFTGPEGRVVRTLFEYIKHDFRYCLTYVVCCRTTSWIFDGDVVDSPTAEVDISKAELYQIDRRPTKKEISSCSPHIDLLIKEIRPHGIILFGSVAQNSVQFSSQIPSINLTDPSKILEEEYKVLPVKKMAMKLDKFIQAIKEDLEEKESRFNS